MKTNATILIISYPKVWVTDNMPRFELRELQTAMGWKHSNLPAPISPLPLLQRIILPPLEDFHLLNISVWIISYNDFFFLQNMDIIVALENFSIFNYLIIALSAEINLLRSVHEHAQNFAGYT